jgi:hypothetical protein
MDRAKQHMYSEKWKSEACARREKPEACVSHMVHSYSTL